MTSFQKIIKYGAIAFAIYLCLTIISMMVFGITAIFGITTGIEMLKGHQDNAVMITKWEQEYDNITTLEIDLSMYKLDIKKGDTLKVDVSDVSEQFKCETQGNKLKIEDKKVYKGISIATDSKPEVTIYIPENIKFEEIIMETGVNETYIEELKADKVTIKAGVGKFQVDSILANYAKIETGAGEVKISHADFEELKLDGGIGKFTLTSRIGKKADIDSGVGKMELNLIGLPTDYKINAETGLGNFMVNGQKIKDKETVGNGDVIIEIDAGAGETIINFKD